MMVRQFMVMQYMVDHNMVSPVMRFMVMQHVDNRTVAPVVTRNMMVPYVHMPVMQLMMGQVADHDSHMDYCMVVPAVMPDDHNMVSLMMRFMVMRHVEHCMVVPVEPHMVLDMMVMQFTMGQ